MEEIRKQNIKENAGTEQELAVKRNYKIGNIMDDTNIIYGQLTENGEEICTEHNDGGRGKCIVVCGASGSGKTHCFAKPNLMQAIRRGDAIIFSDGGELTGIFEPILKEHGYEIKKLDLENIEKSNSWNCIQEVVCLERGQIRRSRLEKFVDTYIANISANRYKANYDDPTVKQLFKAVIAYTAKQKGLTEFTIKDVYENVKCLDGIWRDMDEFFEEYAPEKEFFDFRKQSAENQSGAIHLLHAAMSIFERDEVIAMTCGNDMDLRTFNEKKQAYIINLPMTDILKPISALFATFAIADTQDCWEKHEAENSPCLDTYVLLDEFAHVGQLCGDYKSFERFIITLPRRHVTVNILILSITQLDYMYGKENASELARALCARVLFLGINDARSAEFLKDNMQDGETEIPRLGRDEIAICSYKGKLLCKMLSWSEYPEELKK